jgi:hypothetical protein
MRDRRLYFHRVAQVPVSQDEKGDYFVGWRYDGGIHKEYDWNPLVGEHRDNIADTQACFCCLRGSLEPSHQMIPVALLQHEETAWSPSNHFKGAEREFMRCWACSWECYWTVKDGVKPIKAMDTSFKVDAPPLYLSNWRSPTTGANYVSPYGFAARRMESKLCVSAPLGKNFADNGLLCTDLLLHALSFSPRGQGRNRSTEAEDREICARQAFGKMRLRHSSLRRSSGQLDADTVDYGSDDFVLVGRCCRETLP